MGKLLNYKHRGGLKYFITKVKNGFKIEIPSLDRLFNLDNEGRILSVTGGPIPEIHWPHGTEKAFYPVDILIDAIHGGDIRLIEKYYRSIEERRSDIRRKIIPVVGPKAAPLDWMKSILGLRTYCNGIYRKRQIQRLSLYINIFSGSTNWTHKNT